MNRTKRTTRVYVPVPKLRTRASKRIRNNSSEYNNEEGVFFHDNTLEHTERVTSHDNSLECTEHITSHDNISEYIEESSPDFEEDLLGLTIEEVVNLLNDNYI